MADGRTEPGLPAQGQPPEPPEAPRKEGKDKEKEKEKEMKTGGRRAAPSEGNRPLDKKRARDRRAQQALRDRTRSTIHNLSEQVTTLTRVVERQSHELSELRQRLEVVNRENAVLRRANANGASHAPVAAADAAPATPWTALPLNTPPTSIADQLFQGYVDTQRRVIAESPSPTPSVPTSPDITPLLDRRRRGADQVSKVASDIVRTYAEIETLPKQIAVHFLMTHLIRWLVHLDEPSWNSVPLWLRPTHTQRTVVHASWIDRVPWPAARDYLISHPDITIDDWASKYGTSLNIRWPYDPSMVVIVTQRSAGQSAGLSAGQSNPEDDDDGESGNYLVNPVFAHHIADISNWDVGDIFRAAFPEMARKVDEAQAEEEAKLLLGHRQGHSHYQNHSQGHGQGQQSYGHVPASQTTSPSTTTSPATSERPVPQRSMTMETDLDYLPM